VTSIHANGALANNRSQIYIGTVLLELNRWTREKLPTFSVSDWIPRFQAAGFDGIELWENHAMLAGPAELTALEASPLPVRVFNSYVGFEDTPESVSRREEVAGAADRLRAAGVKFNVGRDPRLRETYIRNAVEWQKRLPADCRMLCECHSGTILEGLDAAAAAFGDWTDSRFQAIVHVFPLAPGDLRKWFAALGPRTTHAHVQFADENGVRMRLNKRPAPVRECLRVLEGEGFRGSFTLEFTEGTRTPGENIEDLFRNAAEDLSFLRENLR
jgi:sugar phosphate isomerase/epimerase